MVDVEVEKKRAGREYMAGCVLAALLITWPALAQNEGSPKAAPPSVTEKLRSILSEKTPQQPQANAPTTTQWDQMSESMADVVAQGYGLVTVRSDGGGAIYYLARDKEVVRCSEGSFLGQMLFGCSRLVQPHVLNPSDHRDTRK